MEERTEEAVMLGAWVPSPGASANSMSYHGFTDNKPENIHKNPLKFPMLGWLVQMIRISFLKKIRFPPFLG